MARMLKGRFIQGFLLQLKGEIMFKIVLRIILILTLLMLMSLNIIAGPTNSAVIKMRIRNTPGYAWSLWDDCDSHFWDKKDWGGVVVTKEWGNFHGRDCLKVAISNASGFLQTDEVFLDENWESPVTGFKMDIFLEDNISGVDVKFEPLNHNLASIEGIITTSNLVYNQWKECGWDFTGVPDYSQVAKLYIAFQNLGTGHNPYTFYIDNLRLVKGSSDEVWDNMDDSSRNWGYMTWSDADISWNVNVSGEALDPITHNHASPSNPVSAIYMKWDASLKPAVDFAKLETGNPDLGEEDWSEYSAISVQIYCTATNKIKVTFTDKDWDWAVTEDKRVSNINTWETIEWALPSKDGFNWTNINYLGFEVNTETGDSTGEIYIDNIQWGK